MTRRNRDGYIWMVAAGAGAVLIFVGGGFAEEQPAAQPHGNVMEIETQVDYDQIDESGVNKKVIVTPAPVQAPGMNIKPDKPVVKEEEILMINRALRDLIEANEQLRREREELDQQLRAIRGQRAIEQNRMNAMAIERDAYKQQTDQVLALRDRMEKDVNEFRMTVEDRENILRTRIAELESQVAETPGGEEMAGQGGPTGEKAGEKTDVVTADKKRGRALLDEVDKLNLRSDKLKGDEAKVHYNMGNIFFKQGEYRKAATEYQTAVDLAPQDASAHYNLAFVSSEYLYDHQTAIKHYQQYLFLNPKAEDYALVKEKIVEAELYLRNKLSSGLEKDLDEHERRLR